VAQSLKILVNAWAAIGGPAVGLRGADHRDKLGTLAVAENGCENLAAKYSLALRSILRVASC
jgi:hypothetical protein